MSTPLSDPRVFFAAERTLLAWVRTGLTVMALGFVVSRFGLFLRLFSMQVQYAVGSYTSTSALLGVAFVVIGSIAIFAAAIQHRRFVSTLPQADLPHAYSASIAVMLSFAMAILGIVLAAYLLLTQS